jgi:hypothetical protein
VQCASCSKWRRLPQDEQVPSEEDEWKCQEATWRPNLSCDDPEDVDTDDEDEPELSMGNFNDPAAWGDFQGSGQDAIDRAFGRTSSGRATRPVQTNYTGGYDAQGYRLE